jgi:hypothetical protein
MSFGSALAKSPCATRLLLVSGDVDVLDVIALSDVAAPVAAAVPADQHVVGATMGTWFLAGGVLVANCGGATV